MIRFFGGVVALLLILCVVDYATPYNVPIIMDNNPLDTDYLDMLKGSFMEESNVISIPDSNLDFEYGTIGWKTHNLYSLPPDYIDSTFEDKKSGLQSLRLAFSCDTEELDGGIVSQANHHLFRSSKLPAFDENVYVKFYLKGKRAYGNTWFDDPIYGLASDTSFSITVQAIDEWGERIYTKNLIADHYDKDNSVLVSVRTLETNEDINATNYFEKINNMDYNATKHGSLDEIQSMLDYQYSWVGSHVYTYFASDDTLKPYVYAVYLGNGWYTVIMPVPKETRYLGFDITSYCYGANYGYTLMGVAFAPAVPAKVDAVLYLDGITFIKTISTQDITAPTSTTPTSSSADWTDDIDDSDDGTGTGNTSTTGNNWLGLVLFLGIVAVFVYLAFFNKGGKGKGKGSFLGKAVKTPKLRSEPKQKPILVKEHYRKQKNTGALL
jgi:hypothetical protein